MREERRMRKFTILAVFVALFSILFVFFGTGEIQSAPYDTTCKVACHNPPDLYPRMKTPNLNNVILWKIPYDKQVDPVQPLPDPIFCVDCHNTHESMVLKGTWTGDPQYPQGVPFKSSHYMNPRSDSDPGTRKTDTDCEACHDQSEHHKGQVRLKEWQGATVYPFDLTNPDPTSLETFCLSCHSEKEGTDFPFQSDPTATPPDIDHKTDPDYGGGWEGINSMHKQGGQPYTTWSMPQGINLTCVGNEMFNRQFPAPGMTTYGCHGSGHGSARQVLLLDAFSQASPIDDYLAEKEGFCYGCHGDMDGFEVPSLTADGTERSAHKWDDDDSSAITGFDGGAISCMACHQVHHQGEATAGRVMWQNRKVLQPGNVFSTITDDPILGPGSGLTETEYLCFDCHDSDPPTIVINGTATDLSTIMSPDLDFSNTNGNAYKKHLDMGPNVYDPVCTTCHEHRKSMATCKGCHDFPPQDKAHYTHVVSYQFSCYSCHYGFNDEDINPRPSDPTQANHPSDSWKLTKAKKPFLQFPYQSARDTYPVPVTVANYTDKTQDKYYEYCWFPRGTRINNGGTSSFVQTAPGSGNVTCNVGCHNPVINIDNRKDRAQPNALTKDNVNAVHWSNDVGAIACTNCHDEIQALINYGAGSGSSHPVLQQPYDCFECHDIVYPDEAVYLGNGKYYYHTQYVVTRYQDTTTTGWPTESYIPLLYQDEAQVYYLPVTTNEDTLNTGYSIEDDPTDEDIIEGFCLSCHNSIYYECNLSENDKLFSGNYLAPNIRRYDRWEKSAHNTGGVTTLGGFSGLSCFGEPSVTYGGLKGCHGNGHGVAKKKLLGKFSESAGTNNSLEEEGFCFKCHNETHAVANGLLNPSLSGLKHTGGLCQVNATYTNNYFAYNDIQQAFSLGNHHNVVDSEQGATCYSGGNYELECTSCHLVHYANGKWPDTYNGKSPISLPSVIAQVSTCDGNDLLDVLWGDDPGEKAKDYAARWSGNGSEKSLFEPGGYCCGGGGKPAEYYMPKGWWDETDQIPDTGTFCLDECHVNGNKVPCSKIIGSDCDWSYENCNPWSSDMHGGGNAGRPAAGGDSYKWWNGDDEHPGGCDRDAGITAHFIRNNANGYNRQATRDKFVGINFVMICTDCHDPHGAGGSSMMRDDMNNGLQDTCAPNLSQAGSPIWNSLCNQCHYYYGEHHAGMSCGNASCHEVNNIHEAKKMGSGGANMSIVFDGSPCGFGPDYKIPTGLVLHWDFDNDTDANINNEAEKGDLSSCTTCGLFLSRDLDGHLTQAPQPTAARYVDFGPGAVGTGLVFNPDATGQGLAQLDFTADPSDGYPEKFGIIQNLQNAAEFSVDFWINPTAIECADQGLNNLNVKLRRDLVSTQFWVKNWGVAIMRFSDDGNLINGNCTTEGADHDVLRFWVSVGDPNNMVYDYWCGTWPAVVTPVDNPTYMQTNRLIYDCVSGSPVNTGAKELCQSFAQTSTKAARDRGDVPMNTPVLDPYSGEWRHVTTVWDGRFIKIYLDGCEAASTDMGGSGNYVCIGDPLFWGGDGVNRHVSAYFAVGGRALWSTADTDADGLSDGAEYWTTYQDYSSEWWTSYVGSIDEVKYYNIALSPDQVVCQGCHPQYPGMSVSHEAHFTATYGPLDQRIDDTGTCDQPPTATLMNNCDGCHGSGTTYGPSGAGKCNNGVVDFDGGGYWPYAGDPGETDPSLGTRVCDRCHGIDSTIDIQGWRLQIRNNWNKDRELDFINNLPNGTTDYCGSCHGIITTPGYEAGTLSVVNTAYGTGNGTFGSGVDAIAADVMANRLPANGNNGGHSNGDLEADRACRYCHDKDSAHINQQPDDTMRMVNGPTGTPLNPELEDDACTVMCHDGTGGTDKAKGPAVSTHGNAYNPLNNPYIKQETSFPGELDPAECTKGISIRCIRCHNVHGTTNLSQIRDTDFETLDGQTRTIVFTSKTGADSFDEGGEGIGGVDDTDDLCAACHMCEGPPGTFTEFTTSHMAGSHVDKLDVCNGYMNRDFRGTDCSRCHKHNNDNLYSTVDGFMPGVNGGSLGHRCLECHTSGGLSIYNVDAQFDEIGSEPDNGILSQHLVNYDPTDYSGGTAPDLDKQSLDPFDIECIKCHGTNHPTKVSRVFAYDTNFSYSTSNFRARSRDNLVDFCLSCHDSVADIVDISFLQFGNVGNDGTPGALPLDHLNPRSGAAVGPWNPNPADPDPLTGLPTYRDRYESLFVLNGHGTLDPLNPVRRTGPSLSCIQSYSDPNDLCNPTSAVSGCHEYHGTRNYRLVKSLPGSYDGSLTYNYDGESYNTYDDWCTLTCHARVDPRVNDHTSTARSDAESGDSRDALSETVPQNPTHPTSMLVPLAADYKDIATVKASEYVGSYLAPAGANADDIICVTCHDPHGTNPEDELDAQMVRVEWTNPDPLDPLEVDLCKQCHQ